MYHRKLFETWLKKKKNALEPNTETHWKAITIFVQDNELSVLQDNNSAVSTHGKQGID